MEGEVKTTIEKSPASLLVSTYPWCTVVVIAASDLFSLALAGFVSVWIRKFFGGEFPPSLYWKLWPVLGLFLLAYSGVRLYPGLALSPAEELRRTSLATTMVYLAIGSITFLFRGGEVYSRGVFLMAWTLSLALVPLIRSLVRQLFSGKDWWGYSAVVLGAGKTGKMLVQALQKEKRFGLKPVAVLDDDPEKHGTLLDVPVLGRVEEVVKIRRSHSITYCLVAMPGVPREKLREMIERYGQKFPHLLIVPNLFGFSSLWVSAREVGGILCLEVRQNLLRPWPRVLKRLLDLVGAVVGGAILSPFLGLLALLIKLDSSGPVLFAHERLGKRGRHFKALKFRTMHRGAEEELQELLKKNPGFSEEFNSFYKLRTDPRITRMGKFLRKYSLDELPQLWNVFKGEMSLVGPRPIVDEELPKMKGFEGTILQVLPGITGIWQVSGRNDIGWDERVELNLYYVRNWSPWLDLYLLARTVGVVLRGKGAY